MIPRRAARAYAVGALALALAVQGAGPVAAAAPEGFPVYESVSIEPAPSIPAEFGGRLYAGTLEITGHDDGLAIVEQTDLDGYLGGIREVPFSWPDEALAAQAVAARSYLASDLVRGRSSNGRKYGYDICASTACQVYAGAGLEAEEGGERWAAAVARTAGQILLYGGAPARTYYHSTSGGRTEAVQDIWAGTNPVPYLVGAESPGEPSPFTEWRVTVPGSAFLAILRADGIDLTGDLQGVETLASEDGAGVWRVRVVAGGEAEVVDIAEIRAAFNRHGRDLYPGLLPARRPDGRRYPQAVLSYRFDLDFERPRRQVAPGLRRLLPDDDLPPDVSVVIRGNGWGHHVGMSQYGALAMARQGSPYDEILAHYYGGLRPQGDGGVLPERIAVGLAWERGEIRVDANAARVSAGGSEVAHDPGKPWRFFADGQGRVVVMPPLDRLAELFDPLPRGRLAVAGGFLRLVSSG